MKLRLVDAQKFFSQGSSTYTNTLEHTSLSLTLGSLSQGSSPRSHVATLDLLDRNILNSDEQKQSEYIKVRKK